MMRIAIAYGGRSVEHEVSILTALEAYEALDTQQFEPILVYVDLKGRWWTGDPLREPRFYRAFNRDVGNSRGVVPVSITPEPNNRRLVIQRQGPGIQRFPRRRESDVVIDIWMPLFHGTYGEDGCVQGLFELIGAAYTGCDVLSAAAGMSKPTSKKLASRVGVPVLPWMSIHRRSFDAGDPFPLLRKIQQFHKWPLFIKPANLGSSIGASRALNETQALVGLVDAFQADSEIMIEPCIENLAEINLSVRKENGVPIASVVEMPVVRSATGVLSYDDKYLRTDAEKRAEAAGLSGMIRTIDPVDLPNQTKEAARQFAIRVYTELGCSGVSRIDFLLDTSRGDLWFNEINTLPGSLAHYLWAASDPSITYTDLLTSMIMEGLETARAKSSLDHEFGFHALK